MLPNKPGSSIVTDSFDADALAATLGRTGQLG